MPAATATGGGNKVQTRTAASAQAHLPSLPNRLLTITEAADYLSVPARWVQDAVQQRRIRCTRIGKHVRFTPDHLAELIADGEQPVAKALMPHVPTGRRSRL